MTRDHGRTWMLPRVIVFAALVAALAAPTANAAFPGRDGLIAFSSCVSVSSGCGGRLYVAEPDGSSIRPLEPGAPSIGESPDWHPDGDRIAFHPTSYGGLSLINANGTGSRAILPGGEEGDSPHGFQWSPDGRRFVFVRGATQFPNPLPPTGVWTMNADASGQKLILSDTESVSYGEPAWSPDGTKLALVVHTRSDVDEYGDRDIYVANADGSGLTNITNTRTAPENAPTWSPDGRSIAFSGASTESAAPDIWVMRSNGFDRRRITSSPDHDYLPDFSPTGTRIAYVVSYEGPDNPIPHSDVWVVDVDGTDARNLTANPGTSDFSPDWQAIPEDSTPPETWINEPRSRAISSRDVTLVFTSSSPSDTLECRLDGGPWSNCHAPKVEGLSTKTYKGLANGSHLFEARATDAAGNVDPTPALKSITVNAAAPPLPDADGDGTPNQSDGCPNEPATTANGCPGSPSDTDGDGVVDFFDACPTMVGVAASRGCPAAVVSGSGGSPPPISPSIAPTQPPTVADRALRPRRITAKARPLLGRRLQVSGRLTRPPGVSVSACRGFVVIVVQRGAKRVTRVRSALRPNCSYRAVLRLARGRRGRGALTVTTRFMGNPTLAARNGSTVRVRVR